jgi:cytochrome c peroxidase
VIDIAKLHELLDGTIPEELAQRGQADYGTQNLWHELLEDREKALDKLQNDLTALYQAGVRHRWKTSANGPRGIAVDADGTHTFVANYFSGDVLCLDDRGREAWKTPVGKQPAETKERHGERLFFDAIMCFQHWQSCGSCHPHGRMDGLRWDLQNDGMGNPKKTRSLVMSHETSPVMSMGVRADMETAAASGVKFILFAVIPDEDQEALNAYIRSMRPEPSPHLDEKGRLNEAARRGKQLFDGKGECAECHFGDLYTDAKKYDVGTLGDYDREGHEFVTPKLIELYRTAPYLHDARTGSLKEVFTKYNPEDKHGKTSNMSEQELDDLVAYLLSL